MPQNETVEPTASSARRLPWTLGGAAALVVVIAGGVVARNWLEKPHDKTVVAANFKKELVALGDWENVEWGWARDDVLAEGLATDADGGSYLVDADHRVGDVTYRFYVAFWHRFPRLSVGVRPAANSNDTDVRGFVHFENGSITDKDLSKLPTKDQGRILALAAELAEAAHRCMRN